VAVGENRCVQILAFPHHARIELYPGEIDRLW
jgi:hypothetical protein